MEDLAKILSDKIEKSQAILASWRDPQKKLSDKEALQQLNNILDIGVLTALKELDDIRKLLAARARV